jgi:hypothetical protein
MIGYGVASQAMPAVTLPPQDVHDTPFSLGSFPGDHCDVLRLIPLSRHRYYAVHSTDPLSGVRTQHT